MRLINDPEKLQRRVSSLQSGYLVHFLKDKSSLNDAMFSMHSGLEWHKIKTLGLVLSCVVKVIPLPVFLETMTIQCGTGQLLF